MGSFYYSILQAAYIVYTPVFTDYADLITPER